MCQWRRLVPGTNLDDMCYKVRKASNRMTDETKVKKLRQWMWALTMHVVLRLAQVLSHLCLAVQHQYTQVHLATSSQVVLSGPEV